MRKEFQMILWKQSITYGQLQVELSEKFWKKLTHLKIQLIIFKRPINNVECCLLCSLTRGGKRGQTLQWFSVIRSTAVVASAISGYWILEDQLNYISLIPYANLLGSSGWQGSGTVAGSSRGVCAVWIFQRIQNMSTVCGDGTQQQVAKPSSAPATPFMCFQLMLELQSSCWKRLESSLKPSLVRKIIQKEREKLWMTERLSLCGTTNNQTQELADRSNEPWSLGFGIFIFVRFHFGSCTAGQN